MNQFKQPLLTILVIFATAYILTVVGCAPQSSDSVPAKNGSVEPAAELKPIPVSEMRECTDAEFSKLIGWSNSLVAADAAIEDLGSPAKWKKNASVVQLATDAINKCDAAVSYHTLNYCKRTKQNIINPTKPKVTGYDAFRIQERCELPNEYLTKFNLRPQLKKNQEPAPVNPPVVVAPVPKPDEVTQQPSPPMVTEPSPAPISGGNRQCSVDEFDKIKMWKASLDQANKNIAKLGSQSNWKYETNSVSSSAMASKSCESLMKYYQNNVCERKVVDDKTKTAYIKIYSTEIIREQCRSARQYNYEFAQRAESLIVANAKLYFDASPLANQTIEAGSVDLSVGEQCLVSNLSSNAVTYSQGQQDLLTAARVYPPQNSDNGGLQMFVFETEQGIKVECYGLDYPGVKTSKFEVERLLKLKNTNISLRYELN